MGDVTLRGIVKRFGDIETIHGVDLDITDGEFCVLVGPSGCGKSTLLRLIAGLEDITEGELSIAGRRVNDVDASDRGVAMVFQSYALYPHMTVAENMGFGLRMAGEDKKKIAERIDEAAGILQLENLLDRQPRALSGGQRQRVAIGRAIVRNPQVFLFDEPLSNLDAELRVEMRVQLEKLHQQLGSTMIYVTHDQVEAMTMADKIVVLKDGAVQQVGAPLELYDHPANQFVAGFLGSPRMNFIDTRIAGLADGGVTVKLPGGRDIQVPARHARARVGDTVTLGVRPEHLELVGDGAEADFQLPVDVAERLGSTTFLYGSYGGLERFTLQAPAKISAHHGDRVPVRIPREVCHLFSADGGAYARMQA